MSTESYHKVLNLNLNYGRTATEGYGLYLWTGRTEGEGSHSVQEPIDIPVEYSIEIPIIPGIPFTDLETNSVVNEPNLNGLRV